MSVGTEVLEAYRHRYLTGNFESPRVGEMAIGSRAITHFVYGAPMYDVPCKREIPRKSLSLSVSQFFVGKVVKVPGDFISRAGARPAELWQLSDVVKIGGIALIHIEPEWRKYYDDSTTKLETGNLPPQILDTTQENTTLQSLFPGYPPELVTPSLVYSLQSALH